MVLGVNRIQDAPSNGKQSPASRIISSARSPIVPGRVATLPEKCEQGNPRLLGGSDLAFVPLIAPAGNAIGDVRIDLPYRPRFLSVVSCDAAHLTDSLFLHFIPLNKTYSGLAIAPVGNETWIPLSPAASTISKVGAFVRFKNPMPQTIYFDIGHEAGGGVAYNMMLLISKEEMDIYGSAFPAAGY